MPKTTQNDPSAKSASNLPETHFNHDSGDRSVDTVTTHGLDGQGFFPLGPKDVFFLSKASRLAAVSIKAPL